MIIKCKIATSHIFDYVSNQHTACLIQKTEYYNLCFKLITTLIELIDLNSRCICINNSYQNKTKNDWMLLENLIEIPNNALGTTPSINNRGQMQYFNFVQEINTAECLFFLFSDKYK
jgi:hypothetical protein